MGWLEAAQGGTGLIFNRLVAPFTRTPEALTLTEARAFSASLGVTAKGRILRERAVAEIEGTIVPAYLFNTLLGNLPLIGRLFSPEAGGGLFAATYRLRGPGRSAGDGEPAGRADAGLPARAVRPVPDRGRCHRPAHPGSGPSSGPGRRSPARPGAAPRGSSTEPAWNGRGPPP